MPSQKQIDANRRNAAKSTGPRTPEGRATVRFNALKHGLTAEDIVLHYEDDTAFNELRDDLTAEYNPQTPTEQILLGHLVSAAWRLRRALAIERGIFDDRAAHTSEHMEETYEDLDLSLRLGHVFILDAAGPQALANLSRYEARIQRSYYKALRELQRLAGQGQKQCSKQYPEQDLQKQTQLDALPVPVPRQPEPAQRVSPSIEPAAVLPESHTTAGAGPSAHSPRAGSKMNPVGSCTGETNSRPQSGLLP